MASRNPPPPCWPKPVAENPAFAHLADPLSDLDQDLDQERELELERIWQEFEAAFTGILIY